MKNPLLTPLSNFIAISNFFLSLNSRSERGRVRLLIQSMVQERKLCILCLCILLLSGLFVVNASTVGQSCVSNTTLCDSAGHFCDTAGIAGAGLANTCQVVPLGAFATTGSGALTLCGTGYTTLSTGSTAITACDVCQSGYYSGNGRGDGSGNSGCTQCSAQRSGCGGSTAGTCAAGYGTVNSGVSCSACTGSTYKILSDNSACVTCASNSTGCGGATLGSCNAGFGTSNGGASCLACGTGTYKEYVGNNTCTFCDIHGCNGQTATSPGTCDAGYTSSDGGATCTQCISGTNYKLIIGNQACTACDSYVTGCNPTNAGTCLAGYTSSNAGISCAACAAGTYKPSPGNTACTTCVANTSSCGGSSAGTCSAGFGTTNAGATCIACSAGSYKSTAGNTTCTTCSLSGPNCGGTYDGICAAGFSTTDNGATCTACAAGKFKISAGNTACTGTCGSFTTGCGGSSAGACMIGYGFYGSCAACSSNTYKVIVNNSACLNCSANSTGCGGGSIGLCNAGYGTSDGGATCTTCSAGTYKTAAGNTGCYTCASNNTGCGNVSAGECNPGYSSTDANVSCTACPSGYYKTPSGAGICILVPAGSFAADQAGSSSNLAATQKVLCPISTWSNTGATVCSACSTGYETTAQGNGAGTAMGLACVCSAGYGRFVNTLSCAMCLAGTYKLIPGDEQCTPCATGKYFDTRNTYDPTKNECTTCDTGYSTLDPIITNGLVSGTTGTTTQSTCICDVGYGRYTVDGAGNAITITPSNAKTVECVKCDRGYYKIEKNDEICILAPRPEYGDTSGLQHAPQTAGVPLWLDFVQPAIVSTSDVLVHIKTAFLIGLAVFVLALVLMKLHGMEIFAGAKAAHASQMMAKLCIGLHVICSIILLVWMVTRDNLLGRTSWPRLFSGSKYEVSVIQHPPRPLSAIFFVSLGIGAAYNPIPAVICIAATLADMIASVISAVEMRAYANLLLVDQAPLGQGYTTQLVLNYYYRDLVSITLCSCILFCVLHVVVTIGYMPGPSDFVPDAGLHSIFASKPNADAHAHAQDHVQDSGDRLLSYDKIDLGGMDRTSRMREQRDANVRRRIISNRFDMHREKSQSSTSLLQQRLHSTMGQEKADKSRNTYFGDGADTDSDEEGDIDIDGDSGHDREIPIATRTGFQKHKRD